MGSDLYNNLIKYFVNHLKTLRTVCFPYATPMSRTVYLSASPSHQASDALQDEALLRYYAQEWDRYTTGANYINRLFTYLNRHWVKRERDEGRKGVYTVYTVCVSLVAFLDWCLPFTLCSSHLYSGSPTSSSMYKANTPSWLVPSSV